MSGVAAAILSLCHKRFASRSAALSSLTLLKSQHREFSYLFSKMCQSETFNFQFLNYLLPLESTLPSSHSCTSNCWAFVRKLCRCSNTVYCCLRLFSVLKLSNFSSLWSYLRLNNLLFILSSACLFLSRSAIRVHQTSECLMCRQVCTR